MPALPVPGLYPFGTRPDGRAVTRIVLSDGTLAVSILSQGAILQDVRLAGVAYGLSVGTDTLEPYLGGMASAGAIMGPVVNRISNGTARIGDRVFAFERNQDGKHTRHGGSAGTHRKLWDIAETSDTEATLELRLPDGEGGFPGNRMVAARFSLPEPGVLELRVAMTTDADTFANFANHSYWALDGTETYAGHVLQMDADRRCLTDDDSLVTGEIADVQGSFFDFRAGRVLTPGADPKIDTNMCVARNRRKLTRVLSLTGATGVTMTLETTEPGVQIYDGAGLNADGGGGHDGRANGPHAGLAIEAQGWPDAPNQPGFPSILLQAGHAYEQVTRFRFHRA